MAVDVFPGSTTTRDIIASETFLHYVITDL
jgi:hypothetical protein